MKVPDAVGVPLIVMVLDAKEAFTPAGKPVGVPIPVAPVILWVILVIKVLIHGVGDEEGAPAVLVFTITFAVLPLWGALPQVLVKPTELMVIPEEGAAKLLMVKVPVLVVVPVKATETFAVTFGLVVV